MKASSTQFSKRSKAAAGFTLIEVLTAIGIIGIVSVSLYAGLATSFNSVHNSRLELRATHILTEKLEALRLFNWEQVNTSGFIPRTFTERYDPTDSRSAVYQGQITLTNAAVPSAYADTMRSVVAEITWDTAQGKRQKRMETLISQYGIQNYLY
ncbi:MAG TPA: type II secretion system protein [Verrucomicrobiae bacterium]|nr:type II secretion system protein [Verrucomicrobiae bacterium]